MDSQFSTGTRLNYLLPQRLQRFQQLQRNLAPEQYFLGKSFSLKQWWHWAMHIHHIASPLALAKAQLLHVVHRLSRLARGKILRRSRNRTTHGKQLRPYLSQEHLSLLQRNCPIGGTGFYPTPTNDMRPHLLQVRQDLELRPILNRLKSLKCLSQSPQKISYIPLQRYHHIYRLIPLERPIQKPRQTARHILSTRPFMHTQIGRQIQRPDRFNGLVIGNCCSHLEFSRVLICSQSKHDGLQCLRRKYLLTGNLNLRTGRVAARVQPTQRMPPCTSIQHKHTIVLLHPVFRVTRHKNESSKLFCGR